jgi:nucleoside-diphosphate-sugar epimerase
MTTAHINPFLGEARSECIIGLDERILVTGANGFIGSKVVRTLLLYGFKRVRCLTRPTSSSTALEGVKKEFNGESIEIVRGNLLSPVDCTTVVEDVSVIYHLAAGTEKTFPGCFLNSVVTTRNLLEAVSKEQNFKRFVNISSLSIYSNEKLGRGALLDETCEIDARLVERHDPYAYGKAKQDEIVQGYARSRNIPCVIVRPGVTFGPGKAKIPGRVGMDTFGIFLHLGLGNRMPFTYVDNCAEAIVLAGLRKGIEGEIFNIVDDNLPKSREFLRMYKKQVRRFASIPVPYGAFYLLNLLWEKYSKWSEGQLPPVFNRHFCAAYFKGNAYSNTKAKLMLGWSPKVTMSEGLSKFFGYARGAVGGK